MNVLTVLLVAVLAACTNAYQLGYPFPGVYGGYPYRGLYPEDLYPGLLPHAYSGGFPQVTLNTVPHTPITYNVAPVAPVHVAPFAHVAPVTPVKSQYHAQDELGQYSFGYAGGPSSRAETRDAFGVVRGSYNYVDPEGEVQTQHYVSDAGGFRVSATNLPVAPDAPIAEPLSALLPEPVQDTPEVAEAKAAHLALLEEAKSRRKRSVTVAHHAGVYSNLGFPYGHPLQYTATAAHPTFATYARAAPAVTTYAAATAVPRDATLLRVVHNPGHAVSYRVY